MFQIKPINGWNFCFLYPWTTCKSFKEHKKVYNKHTYHSKPDLSADTQEISALANTLSEIML